MACMRCGGLVVKDWSLDILNDTYYCACLFRCVNCGDIIDNIIARHKTLSLAEKEAMREKKRAYKKKRKPLFA